MTTSMNTSGTDGGRFDFEDGGSFIGEWDGGRAHGLGIATGPENQGEYSGEWQSGFESCGVYVWPSGNMYSGSWIKGKRHGEGVQIKGRWIYRGAFTTGFCGRYGIKESLTSQSKYEGSWHLNQFDGFGIETNSDGSTYAGAWSKGVRQGLGIRISVPYGLAADYRDAKAVRASQSETSITSTNDSDRPFRDRRLDEVRNGFVLRGKPDPPSVSPRKGLFSRKLSFKKGIFSKLRKQKSTGDLTLSSRGRAGGSLRSNISTQSQMTNHSMPMTGGDCLGNPFMEENIINPNVTETYQGQWNEDKRSGYGIGERSDGLRYEGEWFKNMKDGFGVTYFPDGTKEEGRYKANVLVTALNKKNKLLILRNSRLKESVDEAVRKASEASSDAKDKAVETANQRSQTARLVASNADTKARESRQLSDRARIIAREFAPDFHQPGVEWERNRTIEKPEDIYNNSIYSIAHSEFNNYPPPSPQLAGSSGLTPPVCLEVSGGSRRGSFRSSFRRGNSNNSNNSSNSNGYQQENNNSTTEVQTHPLPNKITPASRDGRSAVQNEMIQRTQAGPGNMATPMNKVLSRKKSEEIYPHNKSLQSNGPRSTRQLPFQEAYIQPQQQQPQFNHAGTNDSHNSYATTDDHFDQYSYYNVPLSQIPPPPYPGASLAKSKRDSGLGRDSSLDEPGQSGRWDSDTPDSGMSDVSQMSRGSKSRRRTLPSIMTAPPIQPSAGASQSPAMEDIVHSVEDLQQGVDASTFIIENGIRKRVQAESRNYMQSKQKHPSRQMGVARQEELAPLPRSYRIKPQSPLSKDLGEGSLPDVTVCRDIKRDRLMSRDEVSRLGMARRQELIKEAARRKRGEFIIRLADMKRSTSLPLPPTNSRMTPSSNPSSENSSLDYTATPPHPLRDFESSVFSKPDVTFRGATASQIRRRRWAQKSQTHYIGEPPSASLPPVESLEPTASSEMPASTPLVVHGIPEACMLICVVVKAACLYRLEQLKAVPFDNLSHEIKDWIKSNAVVVLVLIVNVGLAAFFLVLLTATPPSTR